MKKLYTLLGMVGLIAFSTTSIAQCSNDNTQFGTSSAPTTANPVSLTTCIFGGEYRLVTNMVAGSTYTFATCGDTDFDTQITVFNNASGAILGYNDDFCGLQSSVTFTSDGSAVRVSIDRYFCQDEIACMTLVGSVASAASNPCANIVPLGACGDVANFSLSGNGTFNGNGPFGTPGAEQIYSFTATVTGSHLIDVSHSGGGWVDLFSRTAASGCSGSGCSYIDDVLSSATNAVTLTAGTTYYFMIDDENTTGSTGSIEITCPSSVDPCSQIVDLSGCGAAGNFQLSGFGAYNNNGPWNTPGGEQIFSYTAPYSGDFEIEVSHTGGSYIDLFSRTSASGCSGSGWTYEDDILGSATNTINLVGGTTYYFLLDDENTTTSTGSITITCPCIPSTSPDGAFTYNGPFTISGSTSDECNDCNLRGSDDQIYSIEILCAGTYTFSTCGGASFDTYLYLTDAFCGNVIALNDDSPCGGGFSLQSTITTQLAAGTYFISIEAFSTFSSGDFDLTVSGVLDPIAINVSSTDVSCFGGSDGTATGQATSGASPFNYVWSDGQMTATASGLSAGTYTVGGTDANGCAAAPASVMVIQPDQIEANVTPQNHVIDCIPIPVDLSANTTGGTGGPYTYLWSTGETTASISVNPNVTTTYSVAITDGNGCTENAATNSTTVTVINRCGKNSNKVLICHVPAGNPGNAHTICISPNALSPHMSSLWNLHGGDYCGPCNSGGGPQGLITTGEANLGDNSFIRAGMNANDATIELSFRLDYDSKVRLEIYDMAGVLVDVVFDGNATEGELTDLHLQTDKISSGVYIYQFITDHETHIDKLQIIQ